MSGIRLLIALLFLFAGLDTELRADASQVVPANSFLFPSDCLTNLNNKASIDKMTQTVSEGIHGFPSARVIDLTPNLISTPSVVSSLWLLAFGIDFDPLRSSGCSPPV